MRGNFERADRTSVIRTTVNSKVRIVEMGIWSSCLISGVSPLPSCKLWGVAVWLEPQVFYQNHCHSDRGTFFGHHGRTKMKMIVRLLLGWVMIVNLFPVSPPTLPHFPYLYFLMEIFVNQWHFCLANISTHKWPKVWPQYDHLHSSLHLYFSEGNRHETERNQSWGRGGEDTILRT